MSPRERVRDGLWTRLVRARKQRAQEQPPEPRDEEAGQAEWPASSKTVAEKVDFLFANVHPRSGEISAERVATAIQDAGGPVMSAAYLSQLRKGHGDEPSNEQLEAVARFFGAPPSYFTDPRMTARADTEVELLALMRDTGVVSIHCCSGELTQAALRDALLKIKDVSRLDAEHRDKGTTTRDQ